MHIHAHRCQAFDEGANLEDHSDPLQWWWSNRSAFDHLSIQSSSKLLRPNLGCTLLYKVEALCCKNDALYYEVVALCCTPINWPVLALAAPHSLHASYTRLTHTSKEQCILSTTQLL